MTRDERLGPPPVEPLSDAAWSRVERGVWSRLDAGEVAPAAGARPPRRWWLVAAAAAAAAIVALVVGLRDGDAPGAVGDEPSRVVSGAAPSAVSFGDAHLALDANTALVLSREDGHPMVLIEHGAAWFTVAPRAGRPDFIVRAGDASVRVVGTQFRVSRSDERITVDVERGLVDVRFRGAVAAIAAREHWSSESPGHATAIASAPPPAEVDPAPPTGAADAAPAPAAPDPTAPAPAAPDPAQAAPAAPAPATPALPRGPVHSPRYDGHAAHDAGQDARPAPPATAAAGLEPRLEYDRLAALEPTRPDAALAGYLALARRPGPWADPALFAAARLAADRHDRRAAALLGSYLQRFPAGANATDARHLLTRVRADGEPR